MKKSIHPDYQDVLFVDSSTGAQFLIGTTLQSKERGVFNGKEYPLVKVPISSSSHPFFTKANQFIDSEGRVDKFAKKYQRQSQQEKERHQKEEAAAKEKAKKPAKKK